MLEEFRKLLKFRQLENKGEMQYEEENRIAGL